ncbi:MAG: class I SAM-dependent methyltransferase [Anaerolineaceae bacterium]
MRKKKTSNLFNTIAPVYALYYNYQHRHYKDTLETMWDKFSLSDYNNILDVGCGTGALAAAFKDRGLQVTGIDTADKMLAQARKRPENAGIEFMLASAIERLPFEDNHFDLSIASFVAHGLPKAERQRMYTEMNRVTKSSVIIYDYNKTHSLTTSVVEWLEHGDYFNFIKGPRAELMQCFASVEVLDVDARSVWYICTSL